MKKAIIATLVLVWSTSCSNPKYCAGQPGNMCADIDAPSGSGGSDAATPCTNDSTCSGATPACDTGTMTCVQCTPTDMAACVATTPICAADDACHACASHSQCSSNACLPDGSCGDDTNVAYVDPAGSGAACTKALPCAQVAQALATSRPFIKLHGTVDESVAVASRSVSFIADTGAILMRSSSGTVGPLTVSGTSNVQIFDLIIGPTSSTNSGIVISGASTVSLTRAKVENASNGGIIVQGGTLNVASSTFTNNTGAGGIYSPGATGVSITGSTFTSNSGGSAIIMYGGALAVSNSTFKNNIQGGITISLHATFVVVGNVFFSNGTASNSDGGVAIDTDPNAINRLDFNTFAKNLAANPTGPAIQCTVTSFTARNNIMSNNTASGVAGQTAGTCAHAYSISTPGTVPTGTGNMGVDPLFVDLTGGDLHLTATSPARGAADPASVLSGVAAADIDGDARTAPADIGADEFKP